MKVVVKYVSERGRAFDTPQEAIAHDEYLPKIISTYEKDLKKCKDLGDYERCESIEHCIKDFKEKWERAKASRKEHVKQYFRKLIEYIEQQQQGLDHDRR